MPSSVGWRVAYTLPPPQNGVNDILGALLSDLAEGLKEFIELWIQGGTAKVSQYRITVLNTKQVCVNSGS